ncbi:MAG: hypothetical protein QM500_15780 [Methylococcales bacterium]
MNESDQKKPKNKKPENMSEEQWADYQHMNAHPGKVESTMTGSIYAPSKEEYTYYKKWTSDADKARASEKRNSRFIAGVITFIICMLFISIVFQ